MLTLEPDTITLPDPPAVPGLRFRHSRGESDYAGLLRSTNAARAVDSRDWVLTLDDVVREYNHLFNSDPAQDMIIAEVDGALVGFARGEWWSELKGDYRYWVHPILDPAWRGHGIRRAMLRWLEARLRLIAAGHPPEAPKASSIRPFCSRPACWGTLLLVLIVWQFRDALLFLIASLHELLTASQGTGGASGRLEQCARLTPA